MHADGALAWRNVQESLQTWRNAELRINGKAFPLATVGESVLYGWARGFGKAIQNPDTDRWGKR